MLMDASFSVGFTYGYSRCPASRDATHRTDLTEGSSYLSAYGPLAWARLGRPFGAAQSPKSEADSENHRVFRTLRIISPIVFRAVLYS